MTAALALLARLAGALPGWIWSLICAGVFAWGALSAWQLGNEREAHTTTRTEHAEQIARMAHAAVQAEARHNKTTADLATRILEDSHATQVTLEQAAAELAAGRAVNVQLRAAEQRLRDQLAALAAASCGPAAVAAAAGDGPAAQQARDLLTDVQRRLDEATEGIAGFADAASAAGVACERAYDRSRAALMP